MGRKRIGAALAAAALMVGAMATSAAADPPTHYDSPVPVLETPTALPDLAPGISSLSPVILSPDWQPEFVHVDDTGATPRLVAQATDLTDGAPIGAPVTISDDATAPVTAGGGVVAIARVSRFHPLTPVEETGWMIAWAARDGSGARLVGRVLNADGTFTGPPISLSDDHYDSIGEIRLQLAPALDPQTYEEPLLVVWNGTRAGDGGDAQVHVQGWDLLDGRTAPQDQVVSSPGGSATGSLAVTTSLAPNDTWQNPLAHVLVSWIGSDPGAIGPGGEQEVLGRVLDGRGAPVGSVVRISHVGSDGDAAARPLDETSEPLYPTSGGWKVAWSQSSDGSVVVRRVDASGQGGAAAQVAVTPSPGESAGRLVLDGAYDGGSDLFYEVGPSGGPTRVALQPLDDADAPVGPSLAVSPDGVDASAPALLFESSCNSLALWHQPDGTAGRVVWRANCKAPAPPGLILPPPGTVVPVAGAVPRAAVARPSLRLTAVRLSSARFAVRVGRTGGARLRLRVSGAATVKVTVQRCGGTGAVLSRCARPRKATALATLKLRRAGTASLLVTGHGPHGRALAAGRYQLALRSTGAKGLKSSLVRVRFTLLAAPKPHAAAKKKHHG